MSKRTASGGRRTARFLLLLAALPAAPPVLYAGGPSVNTYIGPNGGFWNSSSNWSIGVPAPGTQANITLAPVSDFIINYDGNYLPGAGTQLSEVDFDSSTTSQLTFNQTTAGDNLYMLNAYVALAGQALYNHSAATLGVANLSLGRFLSGRGSYQLSGTGVLTASVQESIGDLGTGSFTQTGGSNTTPQAYLAPSSGTIGTYQLSGGSFGVTGNLYAGGDNTTPHGSGALLISGTGSATVGGKLRVYNSGSSQLNLSGGLLRVGTLDLSSTPSRMTWTGGTLAFSGGYTINSAFALGATVTLPSTGVLANDAAFASNNGTINLNGGTLAGTGTLNNNGTISGTGTINVPFSNHVLLTNSGSTGTFAVNANVTSDAHCTFNATHQLWAPGTTFANSNVFDAVATFGADTGGAAGAYNLTIINDNGAVTFTSTQHLAGLEIDQSSAGQATAVVKSVATPFAPSVLNVTNLSFTLDPFGPAPPPSAASLDLTNNELIVQSPLNQVRTWMSNGMILSTSLTANTALGYMSLAGGKTEVRYTLRGDANLSGTVDVGDLGALATFYGLTTGAIWSQGDSNNDGIVNVGDLGALATNYGNSLAGGPMADVAAPSADASSVPEPTMVAAIGVISLWVSRRRGPRRRIPHSNLIDTH